MFIFRLGQKIEEMVNLSTTALWKYYARIDLLEVDHFSEHWRG